jgi:hypothetical protein
MAAAPGQEERGGNGDATCGGSEGPGEERGGAGPPCHVTLSPAPAPLPLGSESGCMAESEGGAGRALPVLVVEVERIPQSITADSPRASQRSAPRAPECGHPGQPVRKLDGRQSPESFSQQQS